MSYFQKLRCFYYYPSAAAIHQVAQVFALLRQPAAPGVAGCSFIS